MTAVVLEADATGKWGRMQSSMSADSVASAANEFLAGMEDVAIVLPTASIAVAACRFLAGMEDAAMVLHCYKLSVAAETLQAADMLPGMTAKAAPSETACGSN